MEKPSVFGINYEDVCNALAIQAPQHVSPYTINAFDEKDGQKEELTLGRVLEKIGDGLYKTFTNENVLTALGVAILAPVTIVGTFYLEPPALAMYLAEGANLVTAARYAYSFPKVAKWAPRAYDAIESYLMEGFPQNSWYGYLGSAIGFIEKKSPELIKSIESELSDKSRR